MTNKAKRVCPINGGGGTLVPDGEDLESATVGGQSVVRRKTVTQHSAQTHSGLGRKIIRRAADAGGKRILL